MSFTKDTVLQIIIAALMLFLVLALAAGQMVLGDAYQEVAAIIGVALIFAVLALGTERGTEILKIILRFIFSRFSFLNSWQPQGAGSVLLAAVLAYAEVQKFDITLFNQFPLFANVDPQLVSYITMAVLLIGSSLWHSALPDSVGRAQAVKPKKLSSG